MRDMPKKYNDETEELITKFHKLQEERVEVYRRFETSNKEYLDSGPNYDFVSYRSIVNSVTANFKRISEEVIDIEKALRLTNVNDVADIIASIQDCERKKLELTVEHQLARQMVADSNGSEFEVDTERDIRRKLGQAVDEINDNLTELRYLLYDS